MRRGNLALPVTILFTATIAVAYGFGVYLFASLVPDMREELGLDYAAVGAIGAARQVAFLATALATPAAVPCFGAGRVVSASMLACGAALCGLAMTDNASIAIGLLVALNAVAASAWIPMVSLVSRVVPFAHRGKAIGLIASGTNYGLCANGILVPVLLTGHGWRSVWLAAGSLTLVLCAVLWLTMRRAALLSDPRSEPRQDDPPWRVASASPYLILYALAGLGGLAGVPFANFISAYLREDLRLSVAVSGRAWLAMGVSGAVGGVLLGMLGDRIGLRSALAIATMLLSASGLVVATGTTPTATTLAASGFGASFFSIFGLLPAYVGKTADRRTAPTICGLVECALGLGGSAGSVLGGLSPRLTGSFRPVFVCAAVLGLIMLALTRLLPSELTRRAKQGQR